MDRFIVCTRNVFCIALYDLKSNMDRFIDGVPSVPSPGRCI